MAEKGSCLHLSSMHPRWACGGLKEGCVLSFAIHLAGLQLPGTSLAEQFPEGIAVRAERVWRSSVHTAVRSAKLQDDVSRVLWSLGVTHKNNELTADGLFCVDIALEGENVRQSSNTLQCIQQPLSNRFLLSRWCFPTQLSWVPLHAISALLHKLFLRATCVIFIMSVIYMGPDLTISCEDQGICNSQALIRRRTNQAASEHQWWRCRLSLKWMVPATSR